MESAVGLRIRRLGRGTFLGGIVATAALHGAIVVGVYFFQVRRPPPPEGVRDLMVTKLVQFGKPREKFWLPRIVQPPRPKAPNVIKVAEDPNAPAAEKAAPKPEDAEISKDLRRALTRARALAQGAEEPPEGSLTGSASGTSSEASAGDEYATQIHEAIKRNWTVPTGLIADSELQALLAEIRVAITEDGTLQNPAVRKSSGNQIFDDSCMQAVQATRKVPPPPARVAAQFGRGILLEFPGKELPR